MMEIRSNIWNLIQLVCLLIVLFCTLSWNSPENFISWTYSKLRTRYELNEVKAPPFQGITPLRNKYSEIVDSFKGLNYFKKKFPKESPPESLALLPFNLWKEIELSRQGKIENRGKDPEKSKLPRRKLNYASSKCGAKILASNKEAKYQMSILSEKRDEYMLNPCRAHTWFIIELCDTIEATQIELVNYELYSSSPRKFSTFWSDVYPTKTWHHLGTFEAKDERTMQSFDLDTSNLGKFIKVIISSHYGAEHFCPLSVFRTLGFSMVYEYEDIETKKENKNYVDKNDILSHIVSQEQENHTSLEKKVSKKSETTRSKSHSRPLEFLKKSCELEKKYCLGALTTDEVCLNQPFCIFLSGKIPSETKKVLKQENSCRRESTLDAFFNLFQKTSHSNRNSTFLNLPSTDYDSSSHISITGNSEEFSRDSDGSAKIPEFNSTMDDKVDSFPDKSSQEDGSKESETCKCRKEQQNSEESDPLSPDSSDSAALIQKESVLLKLTTRIRSAEVNLNLINEYLQQMSQQYRQQMKDLGNMFNGTVRALQVASEKASEIDRQQYISISHLEVRLSSMNKKVDFLTDDYENIWKRVLELHGFFLFLEIIILSMVFNMFVNRLKTEFDSIYSEKTIDVTV